jgi:S1/P1 Nuclease
MKPLLPVLFSLLLVWCTATHAWRPEGHRIVAQLAQNRLTQKTWAAIQPYLPPNSNGLPDIANTPDDYARTPAGSWSFCQHFANVGVNATHVGRGGFSEVPDCRGLFRVVCTHL